MPTMEQVSHNLLTALAIGQVDPEKDTITSAIDKFRKMRLRHLVLYAEKGGFFCLCADPEMSKRFQAALEQIDKELDADDSDITVKFE